MPTGQRGESSSANASQQLLRVHSVTAGYPSIYLFLGQAIWVPTHFLQPCSVPCFGPERCKYHDLGLAWKGYAPALLWGRAAKLWSPVVCEITPNAWASLEGEELRGIVAEFKRASGKKRSRVDVEWKHRADYAGLMPGYSVLPVLCHLWSVRAFPSFDAPDGMLPQLAPDVLFQPPAPSGNRRSVEQLAPDEPHKLAKALEELREKWGLKGPMITDNSVAAVESPLVPHPSDNHIGPSPGRNKRGRPRKRT